MSSSKNEHGSLFSAILHFSLSLLKRCRWIDEWQQHCFSKPLKDFDVSSEVMRFKINMLGFISVLFLFFELSRFQTLLHIRDSLTASFIIIFIFQTRVATSVLSQVPGSEILKAVSDVAILAVNYKTPWHCGGEERKQSPYLFLLWKYSRRLSDLQVTMLGPCLKQTRHRLQRDVKFLFCIISPLLLPWFHFFIHHALFHVEHLGTNGIILICEWWEGFSVWFITRVGSLEINDPF